MSTRGAAVAAAAAACAAGLAAAAAWFFLAPSAVAAPSSSRADEDECAYLSLIGNTPMLELRKISKLLQCRVLVKLECNNPGGTGKDRAAKYMLRKAARDPRFRRGCDVVEGTSGSTGIALASLCRAMGLNLHVVMPDDQAVEKRLLLESLGATVRVVPSCAISNRDHYVNSARRLADELGGIFLDQFENLANCEAHYKTTGPEIWAQTKGSVDAFVMSAGTGGTIAGVSQFLKERKGNMVRVVLADPQGSSLQRKVTHGVCFTPEQAERRIKKHRYDSIVEGVGLDRITANFDRAKIDAATSVSDQEVVLMAHWLLQNEGLFVGSSTALNIAAACQVARDLGPGHTIVTIVCDQGQRHASRFWNKDYLATYNLVWPAPGSIPACLMEVGVGVGVGVEGAVSPTAAATAAAAADAAAGAAADAAGAVSSEWDTAGGGGGGGGGHYSPQQPQPTTADQNQAQSQTQAQGDAALDAAADDDDGELGEEFAPFAVKEDGPLPPPPLVSVPPLESRAPPEPQPAPLVAPTTASTPKKPLIRPATKPATPAAAAAARVVAAPTLTGFEDDGSDMASPSSAAASAAAAATAPATPSVEAARVQDLKLKMQQKKEQQKLKRAQTPQKGAAATTS